MKKSSIVFTLCVLLLTAPMEPFDDRHNGATS